MASLNQCNFIGRLGKDPDVKYTQDGKAITSFSIAVTDKWKDKSSGESREKTEWVSVVAFDRLGEICGEYLSKGKEVFISGKQQTRKWEKDGTTHYKTEIVAREMQMLGGRESNPTEKEYKQSAGAGSPPENGEIPF